MVVDDDPAIANQVAGIVRKLGHQPIVCTTWTEAIREFCMKSIDLVLMDAVMPGVDGFKLTKMLRGRSTSYVPIVFLTGLAEQNARILGLEVGADDFLTKPVEPLELQVRIKAMLRIRALTQDLEAKSRALARLAMHDALTGLANRRAFDERLPREFARAMDEQRALSLLLLDIDHFKRVNDTFGHSVGDDLLSSFGRLLGELTRACDLPFRYGGEEFAILAVDTPATQAASLAERIRQSFAVRSRQATTCGGQTLSIGICGIEQLGHRATPLDLINATDTALYRAKSNGRNCVCRYDPATDASAA